MAALLKRVRVSRANLLRAALWASAIAGSIALIFTPSQGLPASAFFAVFAVLLVLRYRGALDALPLAIALGAVGLALGSIPFAPLRDVADGIVACAIISVLSVLLRDAVGRDAANRETPALRIRVAALRARAEAAFEAFLRRFDATTWRRLWISVAAFAVVLGVVLGAGTARGQEGWKLVGGPNGAAVWNASFLEASLQPDGARLRDPAILTPDGTPPRVGIEDSPLLSAAKHVFPGPWKGPEIANLLAVLDLTALLTCAVLFVGALAGTSGGAAIAIAVAVVVSPLLRQVGATAPFDLWPALAVATLALRRGSPVLVAAGAALGLLNVAGGYELAVLALGLGLSGRLPSRFAWAIGIAGLAGSLAGAWVSETLSPDAATLALWWSTNNLAQLVRAGGIAWPWMLALVACAAMVFGWFWSVKIRDRGMRDAAVAAIVAGVLAIPALFGGVPLLVPARLLDAVPLGWPTARILAIATVLLAVPLAIAIRSLVGSAAGNLRPGLRALALVALIVVGFAVARPARPDLILPPVPVGSDAVELPIAESGSRASFVFADDLLERGARISQPVPYVSVPTLLPGDGRPDLAIEALRKLPRPAFVVLRLDVYADPALRFAQPTVIDAADYAVPNLNNDPRAVLTSLTDQARVYQLVR